METWVIHHSSATIHRCAVNAAELPLHVGNMGFRGTEVFSHIQSKEQRRVSRTYTSYVWCPECEAVMAAGGQRRGVE
ncbi:hypothetical protein [Acidithiobacillus sp.]